MTRAVRAAWALLLLGLGLRLGAAWLGTRLGGDSQLYLELGRNLLHHATLGVAGPAGAIGPIMAREPGYPLFIALVEGLCGPSPRAVALAQAGVSAATAGLLFVMVRGLGAPSWVALAALAMTALNPYLILFSRLILTETLAGFFLVASLTALTWVGGSPRGLLLAGLASGALTLTRIQYGPLALALAGLQAWRLPRPRRGLAGLVVLGFALVMSGWWGRNLVTFGELVVAKPRFMAQGYQRDAWVPVGYHAWFNSWMEREQEIVDWLWSVDPRLERLPSRAASTPGERAELGRLFAAMAARGPGQPVEALLDPGLDARFGALARARREGAGPLEGWSRLGARCFYLVGDLPRHLAPLGLELPSRESVAARGWARELRRGALVGVFLAWYPWLGLALLGGLAVRRDRGWWLLVIAVAYAVLLHPLANVVEGRALIPVLPCLAALAAAGLGELVWGVKGLLRVKARSTLEDGTVRVEEVHETGDLS